VGASYVISIVQLIVISVNMESANNVNQALTCRIIIPVPPSVEIHL